MEYFAVSFINSVDMYLLIKKSLYHGSIRKKGRVGIMLSFSCKQCTYIYVDTLKCILMKKIFGRAHSNKKWDGDSYYSGKVK
jgi:hypothetical protein